MAHQHHSIVSSVLAPHQRLRHSYGSFLGLFAPLIRPRFLCLARDVFPAQRRVTGSRTGDVSSEQCRFIASRVYSNI